MLTPEQTGKDIMQLGYLMAKYDGLEEKLDDTIDVRDKLKNEMYGEQQKVESVKKDMNKTLDEIMELKNKLELEIDWYVSREILC